MDCNPARLLCPWDFPGKNTGVGCHFLLQGIFQIHGSNPCLLHWQADSLPLSHMESQIGRLLAYILKISQKLNIEKFEDVESLYVCAYKIYIMYICTFGDKI